MKNISVPKTAKEFAFDDCHKIYILETPEEKAEAVDAGYSVFPIDELEDMYDGSCPLRFVSFWNLSKEQPIPQGE
jgi:hypothetical protein